MSPVTVRIPTLLAALALPSLAACSVLTPLPPAKRLPFDAARVPAGNEWSCFDRTAGGKNDSLCFRTAERCAEERAHASDDSSVSAVGACEVQPSAACYVTHRERTGELLGSSDELGDRWACYRSVDQCKQGFKSWSSTRPYGVTEITDCGLVAGQPAVAAGPAASPAAELAASR